MIVSTLPTRITSSPATLTKAETRAPATAAEGKFTRYGEEREMTGAQGGFTAPYAGTHGWY